MAGRPWSALLAMPAQNNYIPARVRLMEILRKRPLYAVCRVYLAMKEAEPQEPS